MENLTTFLGNISSVFSQVLTWVGELLTLIVSEPVLLIMVVVMPVIGFAVGYLQRLLRA